MLKSSFKLVILLAVFGVSLGFLAGPVLAASSIEILSPVVGSDCQLSTTVQVVVKGFADAPPGQLQQYAMQIDWGDGNQTNSLGSGAFGSGHGTGGPVYATSTHTYSVPGTYTIVSRIYHSQPPGNDNQADAVDSVEVCIVAPLIFAKTATTTYTRAWDWTIDKTVVSTSLLLSDGQLYENNYSVTVDATSTDSGWGVGGTITVTNPSGNPTVSVTNITDTLNLSGAVIVSCPGGLPQAVVGGSSLVCTYSQLISGAINQINTADITTSIPVLNGSTTATVTFSAPTTVTDECVTVTDTATSSLGSVCAGVDTLPKTSNYSLWFGKNPLANVVLVCGANSYQNTATFTTNDTAASGSDSVTVNSAVACTQGCTLTQGYWKTHNDSFKGGTPTDDTWTTNPGLLPSNESTNFFYSLKNWFTVFWTPPLGGNAYYQLAHQYMAAKLNQLNGADVPAPIVTALSNAFNLLNNPTNTPSYIGGLKSNNSLRQNFITQAGLLGAYNAGKAGVPHCSEDSQSQP